MNTILGILQESWTILIEAGIYILFGFFVAGLLYIFIKPETISKYLGKKSFKSVFLASFFGIPLPLCSCGVLPTAVGLKKQGASNGATVSFLISTPESSVDSIAITYGIMDGVMTIARPIAAFFTALFAGILENIFGKEPIKQKQEDHCPHCKVDENCHTEGADHSHSFFQKFWAGIKYAFVDLVYDISKWFIIGIILAGAISYFIPPSFIETHVGSGLKSMIIMLIVGIPIYICATASTPIAAALVLKGLSPGAALVFLLAGPATNMASLSVMTKFLGKRAMFIYLSSIAIFSILFGLFLDWIYVFFNITPTALSGMEHAGIAYYIKFSAAIIFLILIVFSIVFNNFRKRKAAHSITP